MFVGTLFIIRYPPYFAIPVMFNPFGKLQIWQQSE